MACNPSRLELSNAAATTVQITLTTDPGDGTTVTLEVDGLGIAESGTTTSAVVSFTIAAVSAANNSIWDATVQVGANRPATAEVLVTETNTAQTVGLTITDADVTYCGALASGGAASSLQGPIIFTAKNRSGGTMTKGQAVYVSGHAGDRTEVMLADADASGKMPAFGIVNSVSASDNADVELVTYGEVRNMDTAAFAVGATVYISTTPGALTTTKPSGATSLIQNMGRVVRSHATEGIINVMGAGRTNDVPNLADGHVFYGVSGSSVATDLTTLVPDNAIDSPAVASTPALAAGSIDAVVAMNTTQYGSITPDPNTLYIITNGTTSIADSDDVTITAAATNDFLIYTGSVWEDQTPTEARTALGISTFGATLIDDTDAATARTTLGLSQVKTDSYVGHIEAPADGTYYIDPSSVGNRTVVSITPTWTNAGSNAGTLAVVMAGTTQATINFATATNGAEVSIGQLLSSGDELKFTLASIADVSDLRFVVEYTQ